MDQDQVVQALQSGASLGEGSGAPDPLRRIDTHLSRVFLGRDRVFKLKRAVKMPFVDFSTLDRRRAACAAEVEVNRALAPGLYLGAEPVVRAPDGRIRVGGAGEVLDWVVVMRRFPDGALFDEMAAAGTLTPGLVRDAVDAVARFHAGSAPVLDAGHTRDYLDIVAGLRRTEADGAAAHGLTPGPDALYTALEARIAAAGPLIEARRAAGKVRRGHGDLHLRNICLYEGEACPFDALEFDPRLTTLDVVYDLAFLLMDLRHRGLAIHANVAMNRYWDAAGEDEAALALLAPFMALRAAVRTAVAMEAGKPEEAQAYRALGLELLRPVPPRLLAIGGLSGSGKSAVAMRIAPLLPGVCGARLLRTDVIRKAMAGKAEAEPLDQAAYAPGRRAAVYAVMAGRAQEAVSAGASVIADATFQDPAARAAFADAERAWLHASLDRRLERVGARAGDASDATAAVAAAQAEPALEPGWTVLDADGPLHEVVAEAKGVLGLPA